MSKNPSDNKRKRDQDDVEDPELNQTTKRQKLDDGKDAKASPNKAVSPSKKQAVQDEDSVDFDPNAHDSSDSFDDDFSNEED